jgi:phage terminase Nu1 subunit (DNA packaging protein)
MPYATLDQIAHLLKLTPRMVNLHVKNNGMPRISRGQYDMVKCVHWYLDFKDRQIEEARKGDETERQARARLTKASADLKELELARERGRLLEIEVVKALWERIVVAFKTRILAIPTKLAPRLVACQDLSQAKDMLDQEVREALSELSTKKMDNRVLRNLVESRQLDNGSGNSSAKADSKRVGRQKQDSKPGVKRRARKVANRKG